MYDPLLDTFICVADCGSFNKAADKLSAYVKCLEECKAGNAEFKKAKESIGRELKEKGLACVDYFTEKFLPAFLLTLDEMDGLD